MPNRYVQQRKIRTQLIVLAPHNGKPSRDLGRFPKSDGLGLEREDVKYGEYPVATGVAEREDCTLKRPYGEDSPEQEAWLETHMDSPCVLIRTYLGDDDLPVGNPRTYTGFVKGVAPPEGDVTASERAELSVTCIVDVAAS